MVTVIRRPPQPLKDEVVLYFGSARSDVPEAIRDEKGDWSWTKWPLLYQESQNIICETVLELKEEVDAYRLLYGAEGEDRVSKHRVAKHHPSCCNSCCKP